MKLTRLIARVSLLLLFLFQTSPALAYSFIALGDTKSAVGVLTGLSKLMKPRNPKFIIYPGDLEDSGFTANGTNAWKNAMNGGSNNGLFDITFPVRGNHDDGNTPGWQAFYDLSAVTSRVGGSNYVALNDDLTYSFDFENSRFIGVDVPGDAGGLSTVQLAWINDRLTDAESKGLTHVFVYWHGPLYCIGSHCSVTTRTGVISKSGLEFVKLINNHPIVTALFYGHEHSFAYTHLDNTRIPELSHPVEQIVAGDAGAGPNRSEIPTRIDYSMNTTDNTGGYVWVDVNGGTVKIDFVKGGSGAVDKSFSFTKGSVNPPPIPTPPPTPTPTPTPTPPVTPSPTPVASDNPATPTPLPSVRPPSPQSTSLPTPKSVSPSPEKSSPSPQTSVSSDSVLSFNPLADTTLYKKNSRKNYGSSKSLEVDQNPAKSVLLKFEVKGLGDKKPKKASLYLYSADSSEKGGKFYLYRNKDWEEKNINWKTADSKVSALIGKLGKVKKGKWYRVELRSAIKGDGIYTIRINAASDDSVKYASRESNRPPRLEITLK